MYNILVIEDSWRNSENCKHKIKCTNKENIEKEINAKYYDFVYCKDEYLEEQNVKDTMLMNYVKSPKKFEKIVKEKAAMYIHNNILNKLVVDNIKIVEFENWLEEITIASILKELITEEYCNHLNLLDRMKTNRIVTKVIKRNYNTKSFFRKCRYFIKKKKIQKKFWDKLIANVNNDIELMDKI